MADRVPTVADLCCAIAEGHVAATVDGGTYKLSAYELRRYLHKIRALAIISPRFDQLLSSHSDHDTWSPVSTQISVA